jgi:transcriptional regulator with XRE-family HTH domain
MAVTSTVANTPRTFSRDVFQRRARELGAETIAAQADLVGLSRQQLHRLFSGAFKPSVPTIDRISEALDLTVDEFFPRAS